MRGIVGKLTYTSRWRVPEALSVAGLAHLNNLTEVLVGKQRTSAQDGHTAEVPQGLAPAVVRANVPFAQRSLRG